MRVGTQVRGLGARRSTDVTRRVKTRQQCLAAPSAQVSRRQVRAAGRWDLQTLLLLDFAVEGRQNDAGAQAAKGLVNKLDLHPGFGFRVEG